MRDSTYTARRILLALQGASQETNVKTKTGCRIGSAYALLLSGRAYQVGYNPTQVPDEEPV